MKTATVGASISFSKFMQAMAVLGVNVDGASKVSFEPEGSTVKVTFKIER